MAKHSITAVFDTRSHADQAVAQLKTAGVPAADITLLPAEGETGTYTDEAEGRTRGFWASLEDLFGGTDDHATYAESIRRGGVMLSVRADDDRLDNVVDILEQHGSVDLDEREASWRSEGWTGGSALSGTSTTGSSSAMAGSRGLGLDDPGMTAVDDASGRRAAGAEPVLGTLGAGALGAGAAALGTGATTAYEERREVATPVRTVAEPVAERSSLVTDRAVTDRATVSGTAATAARGVGDADETVKVYEERLDVGKRSVSRGRVRVRTSVVSREVSEDVTLHGETVTVDRRTVDRPVSATALDVDPFKERTIELEEFAEEAVVAKSAHIVEEIGIRKEGVDRVETVHETLRSTKVDVEDDRTGRGVAGAVTGAAAGAVAGAAVGSLGRFASQIRGDLEVVGSDGVHVGTVDHMDGERIKLKKADAASGGVHHYLTQDVVQSVAGKVVLAVTAAEAKARWATA